MRFKHIIEAHNLNEANLQIRTFGQRNPEYWSNLIDIIDSGKPIAIQIGSQGIEKVTFDNPKSVANQLSKIWDGRDLATPNQLKEISDLRLTISDGREIRITNIFKSPAIKGVSADYNVGDIGEIALAISSAARFVNAGQPITLDHFKSIATQLDIKPVPKMRSMSGTWKGMVQGNTDISVEISIRLAVRSMTAFKKFMLDFDSAPNNVRGVIASSISWSNENVGISDGLELAAQSKSQGSIRISADGVADQKGTKADLFLFINGQEFNLISAKAGISQLGQATGVDFDNVNKFFTTVFGISLDGYKKDWTVNNQKNLKLLKKVYGEKVIPLITKFTVGDSDQKEAELIKQVANGLIHYANDIGSSGPKIIDIVKLMTTPTKPGFKLMRIDHALIDALHEVDLVGQASPSGLGISVHGTIEGNKMLLFKVRSYFSPAANTTRTVIEGGPLLDRLASVKPQQ